jgi:creatinine amidohydrolase
VSDLRPTWAQGLEILRSRHRESAEAVFNALTFPVDLSRIDFSKYRSAICTGIGSSLAHARYLAKLLRTCGGVPAWEASTGEFLVPPGDEAREQILVIFSQGLSPNARPPLSFADRFGCTVLVTAAGGERGERNETLKRAEERGVVMVPMPVDPEYEVLLRIIGPLVGYALALRIAGQCKNARKPDANAVATAMTDASARAAALISGVERQLFSDPITFVATGGYNYLASNLCAKVVEGMLLPPPAALDALEFAHGFLQEAAGNPRTFVGLSRNSPGNAELFARVRATLKPQHRWLEFEAHLPEPLEIFEHEAAMNMLVLEAIGARHIDQREWPGKGQDRPLYNVSSLKDVLEDPPPAPAPGLRKGRRLEDLTWCEIEAKIQAGQRTVILPLGATEQHGPHLPLRIDSVIADALGERFCQRVPEALQAPSIQIGCSTEHMDFPGTVSIAPETLGALLKDSISSLTAHGFEHVVVFSAHGGNDAALRELEPVLRKHASPAAITVIHDIGRLSEAWAAASGAEGVPPEISGAHAGEFETSIIAGLRPDLVRWSEVEAGLVNPPADSQTLFYPSLRRYAANGVVGDPRAAAAERAERYLAAWVDFIIAAYEEAKNAAAG